MNMIKRKVALVALAAVFGVGGLASCGGDDKSSEAASADSVQSPAAGEVTIIDVRTPAEYAEGHLEGAVNHNVEDGTLSDALASLDPAGEYVVYCRSGRRSAVAAQQMADAGFGNVTDLGSVEEAVSATGLPVVTG
jgi:rhodanese-related sulfurtransferase